MSEPQDESVWTPITAHDNPDPFAYLAPEFRETLTQWMKSVLMDLRQPDAADCHWWRLSAPADPPGEIVTITEDDELDFRSVVRSRRRRAFLRLGDEWRRLAQDPNVDYLLQNAPDLSWIRVYCAGPMPGWARHDELVKA